MKRARVVVVGSSNTDMVVSGLRLPARGETVLGGDFILAAGGKGANQAVAAARLGAEVTFVARLGTDMFGDQTMENLAGEGINTAYVKRDHEAPSGVALIMVEAGGENMIAVAPGANGRLSPSDVEDAREAIDGADVVLLQLEVPLDTIRYAADVGRAAGKTVILNPAPAQWLNAKLLSQVNVLTPNRQEARLLAGLAADSTAEPETLVDALHASGVGEVVVTLGSAGAFASGRTVRKIIPSPRVSAVDATAAGDAFNGALAVALGGGRDLEGAVRFACCAGALAATAMGAQPSLPRLAEVEELLDMLQR